LEWQISHKDMNLKMVFVGCVIYNYPIVLNLDYHLEMEMILFLVRN